MTSQWQSPLESAVPGESRRTFNPTECRGQEFRIDYAACRWWRL